MTKIMKCNCNHKQQDKMYGEKQRVHNETMNNTKKWRCTVCQSEKG